ncbi:MAG: hypothetical protein ABI867_31685 [Kofleriaceae bacterium]
MAEPDEEPPAALAPAVEPPIVTGRGPMGPDGRPHVGFGQATTVPGRFLEGGASFGLVGLDRPEHPAHPRAEALTGSFGRGTWVDSRGQQTTGAGFEGRVAGIGLGVRPGGSGVGFDHEAFSLRTGERTVGGLRETGTRASIIDAGVAAGGNVGGDYQYARFGGAVGWGRSRRFGLTDYNGNGRPELSMGFDAGPVSVDVSSETLGRGYVWARRRLQRALGREPA